MKILILIALIILSSVSLAQVDTTKNIIDKAKIQYKLSEAKTMYFSHNYRGALNLYREILVIDDTSPAAHYGVGECQYSLKNYDAALEHIQDAVKTNPKVDKDVDFMFGITHHQMGNLTEAKTYYEKFKLTIAENKSKMEDYEINKLIAQCDYAIANKDKKSDVTIKNIGSAVNTDFPEFAPCISLDGKTLVFLSRRNDTNVGSVDINYDHLYYSD